MNSPDIKSYYLGKIVEAQQNIENAPDIHVREHWQRIMDGYRSLAGLPLQGKKG